MSTTNSWQKPGTLHKYYRQQTTVSVTWICQFRGSYGNEKFSLYPSLTLQRRKVGWLGFNEPTVLSVTHYFCPACEHKNSSQERLLQNGWGKWGLLKKSTNTPFRERILAALNYLRRLEIVYAYVAPKANNETHKAYTTCIFDTMHSIHSVPTGNQEMRITRLWAQPNWKAVWKNLGEAPVPVYVRSA
jgi:hypothetical protein